MIPAYQDPFPCTTEKGRADFGLLIETKGKRELNAVSSAAKRSRSLCKGNAALGQPACPIQAQCWADNAGETWLKLLRDMPAERPCWHCGKAMEIRPRQQNKRYCDEKCYAAAKREEQRGPDGIIHGSDTGYSQHCKRREPACDPCKNAHRLMQKVRAARKREAA